MQYSYERTSFYPKKNNLNVTEIKNILFNITLDLNIEYSFSIKDISSLKNIKNDSVIFLNKSIKHLEDQIKKVCVITDSKEIFRNHNFKNSILVSDIDLAYNQILNYLYIHEDSEKLYDEFTLINNSFISKFSYIHESTNIQNNCTISRGVKIGKNCIIKNNSIIKNAIIGDNVIIGDNTVIGSTGFGFNLKRMGSTNTNPHIGIVILGNNVSIGSSCTIDRGKLDYTYIGDNSMLDNLIHVGHNVIIGKNVCIAAQTGISGSVNIGNNVIIGGQTGISGHISIGNNAIIAGKSGVTKNIKENSTVAGFPAVDIKEWKKNIIKIKQYGYK